MKAHFTGDGCDREPSRLNALEHRVYVSDSGQATHAEYAAWALGLLGIISEEIEAPERVTAELEGHVCDQRRVVLPGGTEFHGYSVEDVDRLLMCLRTVESGQDAPATCTSCGVTLDVPLCTNCGATQAATAPEHVTFVYPDGVQDIDAYDAQTILEGGREEADAAAARLDARVQCTNCGSTRWEVAVQSVDLRRCANCKNHRWAGDPVPATNLESVREEADTAETLDADVPCSTCGPTHWEEHPTEADLLRCANCKSHIWPGAPEAMKHAFGCNQEPSHTGDCDGDRGNL